MRRLVLGGALLLWLSAGAGSAFADPSGTYSVDDVKAWLAAPSPTTSSTVGAKTCNRDALVPNPNGGAPVHPKCGKLQVCLPPECSEVASTGPADAASARIRHDFSLQLTFETGQSVLTDSDRARLKVFADGIRGVAQRIQIDGYTDASGSRAFNLQLSRTRAKQAMLYLVQLGVQPARLRSAGHGPLPGALDDPSHRLVVAHKL